MSVLASERRERLAYHEREGENIAVWIGYTGIQVPLTVKSSGEESDDGPSVHCRCREFRAFPRLRLSTCVCTTYSSVVTFSFSFLPPSPLVRGDLLAALSLSLSIGRTALSNEIAKSIQHSRVLETFQARYTFYSLR